MHAITQIIIRVVIFLDARLFDWGLHPVALRRARKAPSDDGGRHGRVLCGPDWLLYPKIANKYLYISLRYEIPAVVRHMLTSLPISWQQTGHTF
jgi:hypothetical protein